MFAFVITKSILKPIYLAIVERSFVSADPQSHCLRPLPDSVGPWRRILMRKEDDQETKRTYQSNKSYIISFKNPNKVIEPGNLDGKRDSGFRNRYEPQFSH